MTQQHTPTPDVSGLLSVPWPAHRDTLRAVVADPSRVAPQSEVHEELPPDRTCFDPGPNSPRLTGTERPPERPTGALRRKTARWTTT
ncbi:hypothetical protein ABZS96_17665 [Streptomyces avermitilis]|uniref:hypothetical protein n=1 Tax=Streptomyces avermitilis TaxID=33903 RepID=UPI0033ACA551